MYLEHFGLNGPPFKITPVTDFFFPGANRGEILDALIYAITESEGIVKVTGEVGSGKTMLCRMLLERLPPHLEPVYLANPSLSREEMLYAIADGLGLKLDGQRVNIIMQSLQNLLEEKSADGKRVVILVDEAHAMPLETLEELRLLYNLQLGDQKLLHIVLFGQQELNDHLNQPNMRQLKDRILHHFSMLPLSKEVVISYLLFRMRTAGYHGPNVFSVDAVNLIGKASNGLMRRVNILADKALLAAFVENTHSIEARHVQAAIYDSELMPQRVWYKQKSVVGSTIALLVAALMGAGWYVGNRGNVKPAAPITQPLAIVSVAPPAPATPQSGVLATPEPAPVKPEPAHPANEISSTLLGQRLAATRNMLLHRTKNSASIQLFYTTEAHSSRMEDFLARANKLGKLSEIYVLPSKINGKEGFRVLYGDFPDIEAAQVGLRHLPQRYQKKFSPALYLQEGTQVVLVN